MGFFSRFKGSSKPAATTKVTPVATKKTGPRGKTTSYRAVDDNGVNFKLLRDEDDDVYLDQGPLHGTKPIGGATAFSRMHLEHGDLGQMRLKPGQTFESGDDAMAAHIEGLGGKLYREDGWKDFTRVRPVSQYAGHVIKPPQYEKRGTGWDKGGFVPAYSPPASQKVTPPQANPQPQASKYPIGASSRIRTSNAEIAKVFKRGSGKPQQASSQSVSSFSSFSGMKPAWAASNPVAKVDLPQSQSQSPEAVVEDQSKGKGKEKGSGPRPWAIKKHAGLSEEIKKQHGLHTAQDVQNLGWAKFTELEKGFSSPATPSNDAAKSTVVTPERKGKNRGEKAKTPKVTPVNSKKQGKASC